MNLNDNSYPKGPNDISKHPLLKQAYELCLEIEKLPASEEQTFVITKASRLVDYINCYFEEKGFPPLPDPDCDGELTDEELVEIGFMDCKQCGYIAWDGYICHSCGAKEI